MTIKEFVIKEGYRVDLGSEGSQSVDFSSVEPSYNCEMTEGGELGCSETDSWNRDGD